MLISRIAGIVYGCVLGDSIGLGSEYMDSEEVAFHYSALTEEIAFWLHQNDPSCEQSLLHYITYDQFIKDRHRSMTSKNSIYYF